MAEWAAKDGPGGDKLPTTGPPSIRDARVFFGTGYRGKSPTDERLMRDPGLKAAERRLQPRFIKCLILVAFLLAAGATLRGDVRDELPDRRPSPERLADVRFAPLALERDIGRGVRLGGAWTVQVDDPRFAGLSGLASLGGGRLRGLTDSGVLVDLPDPGTSRRLARLRDLPDGPGTPFFKKHRDAEALIVDADGAGQWVAFENRHSLWRFGRDGGSFSFALPSRGWRVNQGIEAMVREPGDRALLLLPEGGSVVWRFAGPIGRRHALSGATGGIADAARLPDGRIVVAVRELRALGLRNRLAWLERDGAAYRLRPFATLPLGPFDNVEGLAAESLPGGRTRLWAVTDNDGWRRTLLLRMEIARRARDGSERSGTPGQARGDASERQ